MAKIEIVDYQAGHQVYFERFNREWIEKYFFMEDEDRFVLSTPGEAILNKGGAILMALYNGEPAGTVALKRLNGIEYEFIKMAVTDKFQQKGIAEALSKAAINKAKQCGAEKIVLYSHTSLLPALNLYKKLGFGEVPLGNYIYERADIKMELLLNKIPVVNK